MNFCIVSRKLLRNCSDWPLEYARSRTEYSKWRIMTKIEIVDPINWFPFFFVTHLIAKCFVLVFNDVTMLRPYWTELTKCWWSGGGWASIMCLFGAHLHIERRFDLICFNTRRLVAINCSLFGCVAVSSLFENHCHSFPSCPKRCSIWLAALSTIHRLVESLANWRSYVIPFFEQSYCLMPQQTNDFEKRLTARAIVNDIQLETQLPTLSSLSVHFWLKMNCDRVQLSREAIRW